jgi:predicted dehydrogenase
MTAVIDDFSRAEVWRGGRRERWKGGQDKGHREEMRHFIRWVREGGPAPIPLGELETTSLATLRAADALRSSVQVDVAWPAEAGEGQPDGS